MRLGREDEDIRCFLGGGGNFGKRGRPIYLGDGLGEFIELLNALTITRFLSVFLLKKAIFSIIHIE